MPRPRVEPVGDGPRATRSPAFPATWAVVAGFAVLLILQRGGAWNAPFFSDDYILLDKVRGASPFDLVAPGTLAYHYYRPWSRELYHAAMQSVFGPSPPAFHAACFVLFLATVALYFTYARRLAGAGVAGVSTALLGALAAWGVVVEWSSGAQELWMMAWALVALHAFARGRDGWATVAFGLALLSKETAAIVPALAFLSAWWVVGATARVAARRVAPMLALVAVWAAAHPLLGGALWWARRLPPSPQVETMPLVALARSVLSLVNLDMVPHPEPNWAGALLSSLPALVLLGALALVSARIARAQTVAEGDTRRVLVFSVAWAALAWMPLLLPSLIWQSYYTLFGAMGATLAFGIALRRHPRMAVAIVAVVALLQGPRAYTRSTEWGNEQAMYAGRTFMGLTERWLKRRHPTLPRHARLYFADVPRAVVFVLGPGDTPAVRVWYGDTTLSGSYWSQYRRRAPGAPAGPDLFFRHDSAAGWVEVVIGPENTDSAARHPRWRSDHENLAYVLLEADDVDRALLEYEKLARAVPEQAEYAFMAGLCAEARSDWKRAAGWFRSAAARPGATDEMREKAIAFAGSDSD